MRIAVTMRTADRSPGPNYLRQTIENMLRAGVIRSEHLASFDIVASHPLEEPFRSEAGFMACHSGQVQIEHDQRWRVELHEPTRVLTPNEAANEAHVIADSRDADYVLFVEDDLDFCNDFMGSVVRWLRDFDDGAYPLYVFGHVRSVNGHPACAYPVKKFYGTQCYAVPRRQHTQLTQWLAANPKYEFRGHKLGRCHDLRLHHWAEEIGCDAFLAAMPSFCDHTGEVSGMGCPPVKFQSWPGRDWSYGSHGLSRGIA